MCTVMSVLAYEQCSPPLFLKLYLVRRGKKKWEWEWLCLCPCVTAGVLL